MLLNVMDKGQNTHTHTHTHCAKHDTSKIHIFTEIFKIVSVFNIYVPYVNDNSDCEKKRVLPVSMLLAVCTPHRKPKFAMEQTMGSPSRRCIGKIPQTEACLAHDAQPWNPMMATQATSHPWN